MTKKPYVVGVSLLRGAEFPGIEPNAALHEPMLAPRAPAPAPDLSVVMTELAPGVALRTNGSALHRPTTAPGGAIERTTQESLLAKQGKKSLDKPSRMDTWPKL